MISIVTGDIFEYSADVIVIPHSTGGTVQDSIRDKLYSLLDLHPNIPQEASLGDISYVQVESNNKGFKYIVYVCSVHQQQSNYAALWKIAKNLAQSLPDDMRSLTSPLLATGAGGLDPLKSFHIVRKTLSEASEEKNRKIEITFCTLSPSIHEEISSTMDRFPKNGRQTAFDASIEKAASIGYNEKILHAKDFYYEHARNKFLELRNNWGSESKLFYEEILDQFKKTTLSFDQFVRGFNKNSRQYKFLLLCGQLVAYIDSNAANKNEWNEYEDRRTMARSNVRQNIWIESLIKFKINGDLLEDYIPKNVLHALEYLSNPLDHILMLSENHRKMVCRNIFLINYDPKTFHSFTINSFIKLGIKCANERNNGALVTRTLYAPEVMELWHEQLKPENLQIGGEITVSEANNSEIKTVIHSDSYADNDLLDYEIYAKAIQEFLTHKDTRPPLTISIMAPWGKGKTSLMRFIEKKIKQVRSDNRASTLDGMVREEAIESKVDNVLRWLKDSIGKYIADKIFGRSHVIHSIEFSQKLKYPIVWFNAWKFQKTQQVWAAFAHEIIQQLVQQIPDKKGREEFWFKLNLARIDKDIIRDQLYRHVFQKIGITIFLGFVAAALTLVYWIGFSPLLFLISGGLSGLSGWFSWTKIKDNTPDIKVAEFLTQPQYKKEMGYLYQVEQDLINVFKLLVANNRPAVIFIDDLDRCSPAITTEVVEAINLFISSEELKCFFILGQDAQMVAAALDVAYEKIADKISDSTRHQGSLGWSFMEKFIQLQFSIPAINSKQRIRLLRNLMSPDNFQESQELKSKINELQDKIRTAPDAYTLLGSDISRLKSELNDSAPAVVRSVNEEILTKAALEFSDNSDEVENLVSSLNAHLGNSPRSIKRFVNLYRFYRFINISGATLENPQVDNNTLGHWIIIMIRWPQLIRCLQWNESYFLEAKSPKTKAEEFKKIIDDAENYHAWEKYLDEKAWKFGWLKDQELFSFIKSLNAPNSLAKAFEIGIL